MKRGVGNNNKIFTTAEKEWMTVLIELWLYCFGNIKVVFAPEKKYIEMTKREKPPRIFSVGALSSFSGGVVLLLPAVVYLFSTRIHGHNYYSKKVTGSWRVDVLGPNIVYVASLMIQIKQQETNILLCTIWRLHLPGSVPEDSYYLHNKVLLFRQKFQNSKMHRWSRRHPYVIRTRKGYLKFLTPGPLVQKVFRVRTDYTMWWQVFFSLLAATEDKSIHNTRRCTDTVITNKLNTTWISRRTVCWCGIVLYCTVL